MSAAAGDAEIVHGTCLDIGGAGILLTGPSGSGKSDLALRLLDAAPSGLGLPGAAARLVSDDYVCVSRVEAALIATAPPGIAGRMEVRGLGIVAVPCVARTRLALAVELVAPGQVARLPERRIRAWFGVELPLLALAPFEASAVAKLRAALAAFTGAGFAEDVATPPPHRV